MEGTAGSILLATERYNERAPLNLGSGMEVSIKELAQLIGRLTGFEGEIVWDTSKPDDQPQRCLDTSPAEGLFGFEGQDAVGGRATADG